MDQAIANDVRGRVSIDELSDQGLADLIDGMHRIVNGFGGIAQALVARVDRPSVPAPTCLAVDEERAMDCIEAALIAGFAEDRNAVTVPIGLLSMVYRIACERSTGRDGVPR